MTMSGGCVGNTITTRSTTSSTNSNTGFDASEHTTTTFGHVSPSIRYSSSAKSPSMRSSLTWIHKDRDPEKYYDIVQVLGAGSMGEVTKVCKKQSMVGGSAYYSVRDSTAIVESTKELKEEKEMLCFAIPFLSGLFALCTKRQGQRDSPVVLTKDTSSSSSTFDSTCLSVSISEALPCHMSESPSTESTGVALAMKTIHLKFATKKDIIQELVNEVEILKSLDHPNIIRVLETFDYRLKLSVIMELCSGGDLYTRDPYSEQEAARICRMILSAVSYMHANGV